ncbi:MAG: alpha/beta hydrolase [Verrucomicrobiota bacterium]
MMLQPVPCLIEIPPPLPRYLQTAVAGVVMHSVEIGVETGEEAPVFVLVHGLGMSHRYLMATAELLSASGTVHVPDLPGFGNSGKPARVLTIPELADSLAEWMAGRGITRPIMIGNSLGAQVIVDFAVRHPSRLAAAVLVGLTIDPEARRMMIQIGRLLRDIPREPPALYWMAATDYLRAGFPRCLRTLRHALEDPVVDKLPRIQVPVLIVRGEHDPIVPGWWTEYAAALIPQARRVTVPHVAHAVNFSAAEELVKVVLEFERSVDASGERRFAAPTDSRW